MIDPSSYDCKETNVRQHKFLRQPLVGRTCLAIFMHEELGTKIIATHFFFFQH
jgi:hypothetical protein